MDRYPGDKKIDEYFNFFKRFLKEEGRYMDIINYLFHMSHRSKKKFYEDVKLLYKNKDYDFGDILHMVNTLGKSYYILGDQYWRTEIRPLSRKWESRFLEINPNN